LSSILDALKSIVSDKTENVGHKEGITDGVFECAIYRLGIDPKEWMAEPVEEREFILNYLEGEYGTNK